MREGLGNSARQRILDHFLANVGKVVTTHDISDVAGIRDYQRRIRELRDEGWRIRSYRDLDRLKPDEYLLESVERDPGFSKKIPNAVRAEVLARDGYTCQACGIGAGDPYEDAPETRARLQIDHIVPPSRGGSNEPWNLRTLCGRCNQGRSDLEVPPQEQTINMLGIIRRAPRGVQREVFEFLQRKFEK